jgi:hypothetical protein
MMPKSVMASMAAAQGWKGAARIALDVARTELQADPQAVASELATDLQAGAYTRPPLSST